MLARLFALTLILVSTPAISAEPPAAKNDQAAPKKFEVPTDETVEQLTERAGKSLVVVTFIGRDGRQEGLGSGFVISADGLIATNRHVIGEARPVKVQFADGKQFDVVSVQASDRLLDLAVVKIDARDLKPLALGDSDTLKQGQAVVALGNPLGLKHSVVTGVVSGVREVEGRQMIQLAIPIEPGNSGGPLLDMQGRVHGILTMKSLVTANLGFAVTINALKPLIAKPNPIPMTRWLTIGQLDPREWQPLAGAAWRQHAGRIHVEGTGQGFGGRAICLWQSAAPELPYEIAVAVKLDDEAGAAGLAIGSDGADRHYGFYPSAGKMRLSRFEGPDVLSWQVLHDEPDEHYVAGDWNLLRVRVEKGKLLCYVNDHLAVERQVDDLPGVKLGLVKFRQTKADFKAFRVAKQIGGAALPAAELARLKTEIEKLTGQSSSTAQLDEMLQAAPEASMAMLRERAKTFDKQAAQLRQMAVEVHERRTAGELSKALSGKEDDIDLFYAGLLIARLDNDELDVQAYRDEVRRLGDELVGRLAKDADEATKLELLRKFLFEENGFHGSRGDYYNRANSYLNEVLDDREGLPITLSVLYMALAKQIGLNVVGVGLPGHFVVKHVPAKGEPQLIDVYEDAKLLNRKDAAARVRESAGRDMTDDDLAPASKRSIAVRMLRNLLGVAGRAGESAAVLRYLDATLAIDPESAQDRWMRAVFAYRADRPAVALADLDWLILNAPDSIDLDRVRQLREQVERLSK